MEKKEYIERETILDELQSEIDNIAYTGIYEDRETLLAKERTLTGVKYTIRSSARADVVPWSWLEQYATGKRCNFASEFVSEARKEWEAKNG